MLRHRSIRFRLTFWYAAILTAGMALFGGLLWFSLRQRLLHEIDEDLSGRASRFETYFRAQSAVAGPQLRDELEEFCQGLPSGAYVQLQSQGAFAFRCPAGAAKASQPHRTLRREFAFQGRTYELEVGAAIGNVLHTLQLLQILLWTLIPVVVAIATVGGAWLSARALKPVNDITAAALTVSIENLSERLPVPATGDELARLTSVLNSMLARLEAAVKTLSQFVADASHELRTPLAVIRTSAELALRRNRAPESYRESLQEIAGEAERMTQLVENLLTLARSDANLAEMPLAPLDVREVLQSVCAEMGRVAEAGQIRVQASLGDEPAMISGNRQALHRLFLALLDNAIKYSRAGGEVLLSAETSESGVAVTVEDFGAGISEADLPHIFKRFYRADQARSGGGHGLGLALADSIARAHGAEIEVRSTEGARSMFRVSFHARAESNVSLNMGVLGKAMGVVLTLGSFGCFGAVVVQNVTDCAGFGPRVAPGSLASIFGTNLASGEAEASSLPLPTSLGGASVTMGGVQAPLTYANTGQINFQVPSSLKAGQVTLVVNAPGGASNSFSVTVTAEAPAVFQYGVNRAVAQNADGKLNSSTTPAASGSVITVYLTGQGPVSNPVTDGTATPTSPTSKATATASATIGTQGATIQFLGLTPGNAGLAQANIQVPAIPTGDYSLTITIGGFVSASAVVSVSGSGTYKSPLTLAGSASFANTTTSSVALYNNVAYVCGASRIVMVDVTNPTQPSVIGEFGDSVLNGNGDRCQINTTVSAPYLVEFVGQLNSTNPISFAVWSLNNPESPTFLGITATPYGHIVDLSFSGIYGFATTSYITYSNAKITAQTGDFLVFSFANPGRPQFIGILQPNASEPGSGDASLKPFAQVIDQAFAYIASSTATGSSTAGTGVLTVVSLGTPTTPLSIYETSVSQAAILLSFDVSGNTLLAAGNTGGQRNPGGPDFDFTGNLTLTTMDVSNVETPVVLATFTSNLQVNGTFHTAAFTNGVFAIVNNPPDTDDFGPSTLEIVDARTPTNILLYPFQTQFGLGGILTTTAGYLLAPTMQGLNIYQLQL